MEYCLQKKLKDILNDWQEKNGEVDSVTLDVDANSQSLSVDCEQNLEVSDSSGALSHYGQALGSGSSMIVDPEHSLYIVTGGLSQLVQCSKLSDVATLQNTQDNLKENQVRAISSFGSIHKKKLSLIKV